ncbi:MAG: alpha/beta hydrolase [Sporocytophaga sp.]|nr:alpha/beta hydrolase [Sporocytophaga sp.]
MKIFLIAGVSFGGVIAVEIAKKLKPLKTILISSVPTHQEYPLLLKFFSAFPLYRFTPQTAYSNRLVQKFILYSMGFETDEGKRLFLDMLNATNPVFIQWAIDALMKWKNTTIPQSLLRIHGKADKIFPHRMIKDVHYLHGGHSIIFEDAESVNSIIRLAIESTLVKAYSKI